MQLSSPKSLVVQGARCNPRRTFGHRQLPKMRLIQTLVADVQDPALAIGGSYHFEKNHRIGGGGMDSKLEACFKYAALFQKRSDLFGNCGGGNSPVRDSPVRKPISHDLPLL